MLSTNNIVSYLENLEETLKGDVPIAVEQKIKEQNEKAKVCVYCLKVKYIYSNKIRVMKISWNVPLFVNPFHASGLFLHPLKTSENQGFCDVFSRFRKEPVALNGSKRFVDIEA